MKPKLTKQSPIKSIFTFFKRQLFWKILAIFWFTATLTIVANIYITRQISNVEQHYDKIQTKLQNFASDAVVVYESSGQETLQQWYKKLYARHRIRVILLDKNNQALGKAVNHKNHTRPYRKEKQEHASDFMPPLWRQAYASLIKQTVQTVEGGKYTLQVLPSPFVHRAMASLHNYKSTRLVVSLIILALGSLWLSRLVARPVKRLTQASNLMAEGDLSVRVSDLIGARSDELGELSSAFDHMAEKVEALVANQKQLLRDISHEIRTPLTRQQIAIELAKTENGDNHLLEKIERQNHQLNSLIDGLLTFSRLSDNSTNTTFETINSSELLESISEAAELEAQHKNIHLKLNLKTCPEFQGNALLTTRAIDNLLGNALKHSPENSLISISNEVQENYLVIRIEDQGAGIDEAHLSHIFEPFYRADDSRNQATGGYGLGLAIVEQIMKQHHGQVVLKNIQPTGLSAALYFPLPTSIE